MLILRCRRAMVVYQVAWFVQVRAVWRGLRLQGKIDLGDCCGLCDSFYGYLSDTTFSFAVCDLPTGWEVQILQVGET